MLTFFVTPPWLAEKTIWVFERKNTFRFTIENTFARERNKKESHYIMYQYVTVVEVSMPLQFNKAHTSSFF